MLLIVIKLYKYTQTQLNTIKLNGFLNLLILNIKILIGLLFEIKNKKYFFVKKIKISQFVVLVFNFNGECCREFCSC